ncbi:branched-chain amino acid ABC transporter permease [Pelotomaculum schinkii]|uniref:branched-chain amino acid ABC transporter permease n=1 Tax=Pelotomaculum schinkii TaxID=78350 RepID=UPI00167C909E|nr:branched-chain amino acid ABC transporter permease [Pelotomaculum schinkii]
MEHVMGQIINGLQLGFMYALIALGYTMVYGVVKLINFAHGDVFMVGAFVGYFGFSQWGMPVPVAVLTAMAVCAVLGVVIEKIAYRPLRYAPKIAALISALGMSLFLEYFCSLKFVFGPNYRVVQRPIEEVHWQLGGITVSNIQVMVMVTVILMLLLVQYMLFKTKTGMAMRTVSLDHDAARLMGVNVDSVISATFAIGSALAAAGGVLYAIAYPQIHPFMGIMPGLKAFTAAVLGGIGIVPGAVLGALIMGQVETLTAAFLSSQLRDAIAFGILILVLLVRPCGILGKTETEKV